MEGLRADFIAELPIIESVARAAADVEVEFFPPGAGSFITVTASEPIVWFDDVRGTSIEIEFPEGAASDNNRSGLGDETNAGTGDGTDNSTNEGTDNPNQAPSSGGPE